MYLLLVLLFSFMSTSLGISALRVSHGPETLNYTTVTAEVGGTVALPCNYDGDRKGTSWFRVSDLRMMSNSENPSSTQSSIDSTEICSLIIKPVNAEDAGFYKFVSWDSESGSMIQVQHNMVQVIVEGSLGVDMKTVWNATAVVPVVAAAGDTVVLPCSINQSKRVWIRLRDSRLFSSELSGSRGRIASTEDGLQILDVKLDVAGVYRCEDVRDPTSGSLVSLQIKHHKGSMETTAVTVAIGEIATLPCNVEVQQPFRTAWMNVNNMNVVSIGGHRITNDDRFAAVQDEDTPRYSLVLRDVRLSDAGFYTCNTNTDPMRQASVELRIRGFEPSSSSPTVPPIILPPETAIIGATARLSCGLPKNDTVSVSWIREKDSALLAIGDMTLTTDPRIKPLNFPEMYHLFIRFVELKDAGNYTCRLLSGPIQEAQVELIVEEYKPEIKMEVEVVKRVKVEDTVIITCNIEGTQGSSPLVLWYKDDELIKAYEQEEIDIATERNKSSLTINKSTVQHSGEYTCQLKHPTNDHNSTINLQVTN